MLSRCFLGFSVGLRVFVIELSQISSFFFLILLWMAQFSWGTNFRGFRGGFDPRIPVPTEW